MQKNKWRKRIRLERNRIIAEILLKVLLNYKEC